VASAFGSDVPRSRLRLYRLSLSTTFYQFNQGENMATAMIDRASAPRPTREIEGIIERARKLREMTQMHSNNLQDLRRRLLGESDPQTPPAGNQSVKEVVSELVDLRQVIDATENNLVDIGRYIESLERV
jgi:hypothetical protein